MPQNANGDYINRIMQSRRFELVVTHFAPLLFVGMIVTGLIQDSWNLEAINAASPVTVFAVILIIGVLLGALARLLSRRIAPDDTSAAVILALVGFVCGTLPVGLVLSVWILEAVTVFTVLVVVLRVSHFLRTVAVLLGPNQYPTWSQVGMLLYTYLSLLTAFTLINLGMDLLHTLQPGVPQAFDFAADGSALVNAFYLSAVVMTTLGFDVITPISAMAKITVSLQCLTSYVMFALLVGVATRGVVGGREPRQRPL
ncbi:MAG: ion channel [Oceanidesulfovibrio sp.]